MEAIQKQKCVYCKMNMTTDNFKKKRGDSYQKTCNQCLSRRNASAKKRKCPHGRHKNQCIDCGGVNTCEHGRLRTQCRDCGGSQICAHDKRRAQCRDCDGSQICQHNKQRS